MNRTFAEKKKPSYNCSRNKDTEVFSMKFKDIKRHLTITKDEINRYISYVKVVDKDCDFMVVYYGTIKN